MCVSEIRVKRIHVNQGLGVCDFHLQTFTDMFSTNLFPLIRTPRIMHIMVPGKNCGTGNSLEQSPL